MTKECRTCIYVHQTGGSSYASHECRINPPVANSGTNWATVEPHDWCGKWRDKLPYNPNNE